MNHSNPSITCSGHISGHKSQENNVKVYYKHLFRGIVQLKMKIGWKCTFSISSMDPLQWMGAVRMRVQTAYKIITIIHTTADHQLTFCEVKSCMFVREKCIKTIFLNFKPLLPGKIWIIYPSIILLSLGENQSCLNKEGSLHRSSSVVRGQQGMDFVTGKSNAVNRRLIF